MTSSDGNHSELDGTEAPEEAGPDVAKPKPPSPYWWLLMLPIGAAAGQLAAVTSSSLWMFVGAIGMFAVFRKMTAHNIQPKKLRRVKPKTFSRKTDHD